ncbi:hypothetical protein NCC78_05630 [Micromonospora phytophila]|uniref:hypothetical protein n=1 Tax=Micromonospora phytophila TaxID=709888 RepID=UPI002030B8A4|nr:hypothetical protein [Micromonospora phytophila]MCM0674174.1 hypothetical protein [Micromonospora phytophila]
MTQVPDQIGSGPRQLNLMPAAERAGLDPYMQLIVGYRKSGLSLNHIVGCPLDCGYCVRHFWGNFDDKVPTLLVPTQETIQLLIGHEAFRPHITPIQLFNKATDPFLPGVKPHLFQVLRALDERGYTNQILIITRFKVTGQDMEILESLRHLKVTLLFTYSGIQDDRVEPITKSAITINSIYTAVAHKKRTGVVLYWRPIVPGWNTDPETIDHVLEVAGDVDAAVFTGYYHKPENAAYLRQLGVDVPYGEDYARRKTLPREIDELIVSAWKASGITTPLFRKTSYGVSHAHGVADYNGHWGVNELCNICPAKQRQLCIDDYRDLTEQEVKDVLDTLGYESPVLVEPGHVWTHGLGEQKRYAVQHHLRHQIWEANQPHYPGAHGRQLLGHEVDPHQVERFAAIRAELVEAVKYGDDD